LWPPQLRGGHTNDTKSSARDIPLAGFQPAAKIVVDPPLPEPLSRGVVFIEYHTENLQVVPVAEEVIEYRQNCCSA
jgi:hypothetical protein